MKTLKKMLRPIRPTDAATERFSFRIQDGVEIYEHECVHAYKVSRSETFIPASRPEPRLVVDEAGESSVIVAKKRSELVELMKVLKTATVSG